MINEKEKKLLAELNEIRFLDSDLEDEDEMQDEIEEKIDRYENILFELSSTKEVEVIFELCNIAEDEAVELSAVEYLVKTIYKILINNDINAGMNKIIKGTKYMVPKAFYKAVMLHTLILRNDDIKHIYIDMIESSKDEEKTIIMSILNEIFRVTGDEYKVKDILKVIE